MELKHPVHPGELIVEEILPQFGVTVQQAAKLMMATKAGFVDVCAQKRALIPLVALKFEAVFGYPAKQLLAMQVTYDLAEARSIHSKSIARLERLQRIDVLSSTE